MLRNHCQIAALCAGLVVASIGTAEESGRYTVHEWGTFTVLQDEAGNCLPGVNVNEEQLPEFVHRLWSGAAREGGSRAPLSTGRSKGIPERYVSATMRMETPIIYVYPPRQTPSEPLSVTVRFNGGWISEWYPEAQVSAPGLRDRDRFLGELAANTQGRITWQNLQFGGAGKMPETEDHVWLAPRAVAAPRLSTATGETENYLFYRGIAALEAPVRVARDTSRNELIVKANQVAGAAPQEMRRFWLVDVRADGAVAYRQVEPTAAQCKTGTFATLPATFAESEYSISNMVPLRTGMKQALIAEGLYADEAEAMLNTWKLSYFRSEGLRLFFTLPRAWTDHVLPLEISQAAEVQRVMIGRVELVTPGQRELLEELSKASITSPSWLWSQLETMPAERQREFLDRKDQVYFPFEELGVEVPADYQLYVDLGRFRDALLLDAIERGTAGNIEHFARQYRLANE